MKENQRKLLYSLCFTFLFTLVLGCFIVVNSSVAHASSSPSYTLDEKVAYQNDGSNNFWWTHMRCASIPNGASPQIMCTVSKDKNESPTNLSDVFYDIAYTSSADLGETWSSLTTIPQFQWKTLPDGYQGMLIDPVPVYHKKTGKIVLFGMAQSYGLNFAKKHNYPAYAIYDPASSTWSSDWYLLDWPNVFGHTGSVYPYEVDDGTGDLLWPINLLDGTGAVKVIRASFNGTALSYMSQGSAVPNPGGNGNRSGIETSLTQYNNEYFMTLRDDTQNRLAKSSDGLIWQSAVTLQWEDGTAVTGSMNTQMHWVTQPNALYLVYTRQDASNTDILRYRAPLWMAEVDPVTLRVKKNTEQIVMSITDNRAQLGNFGTTAITPDLSVVTSNEWRSLVPNRAIVSRIWWNKSIVGNWSLDETSGNTVVDSATGLNPGTIVNATRNTNGKFGSALTFDGSGDYVNLGDPASGAFDFGTSQNFSVSAWVKTSVTGTTKYILNKGDTNASYWLRFEENNTIKFLLDYGSTFDAAQSTATYTDGLWHHVVGVADRVAGLKLYVDGVLVGQDNSPTSGTISNSLPLTIGNSSSNTMNGLIDEVRLYNYALNSAEVGHLYGLNGYWKFDETTGSTVLDSTYNGYHGTITNAVRSASGMFGGALSFDGNGDYVSLGDPFSNAFDFGTTGSFSVSAWVKTSMPGTIKYIVNKGDTNAAYWLRFETNNTIKFLLDYGSTSDAVQSTATFADGQWHHVVAVADRALGLKLYVDSVLVGQNTTLTGGNISNAFPLTVGVNSASTMNGLIDQVSIYAYPLSAADVQSLQ
ncbi:sialidase family protein [Paenibacillus sp. N3.4]|uniref:sialidase family protein n=1 Tax=Paenibacillus sp. N3.4 TaxID=2603222 RepID=UPI00164FB48F|nr:sialidase family protein [Paenibacillus sp. N3.4]